MDKTCTGCRIDFTAVKFGSYCTSTPECCTLSSRNIKIDFNGFKDLQRALSIDLNSLTF